MNQPKGLCTYAELALAVANCTQVLSEAELEIAHIVIMKSQAVVFINHCEKVKKLNGKPCGETYLKGVQHFVYQKDICGVLVRWIEPNFSTRVTTNNLH